MNTLIFNIKKGGLSLLLVLIIYTILIGCIREEVIKVDRLRQNNQPVVLCALSPGDSIKLMLIQSMPLNNKSLTYKERGIYDADVKISNERGDTVSLKVDDGLPIYKASQESFPILPGERYNLSIMLANQIKVNATTTVPQDSIKWSEFKVYDKREVWEKHIDYKKSGNTVYKSYSLRKSVRAKWMDDENRTKVISTNKIVPLSNNINSNNFEHYLDDYVDVTSCCKILKREDLTVYYKNTYKKNIHKHKRIFHLITLNDDLKEYFRMYDLLFNNDEDLETGQFLNLFRGVVPEYTNINGGLGIFGAYIVSDKRTVQ